MEAQHNIAGFEMGGRNVGAFAPSGRADRGEKRRNIATFIPYAQCLAPARSGKISELVCQEFFSPISTGRELTIHGICTALASAATMAVLGLAKLAR